MKTKLDEERGFLGMEEANKRYRLTVYQLDDIRDSIKALDYKLALDDIFNNLRSKLKYDDKLTEQEYAFVEKLRSEFFDILQNYNINLDE